VPASRRRRGAGEEPLASYGSKRDFTSTPEPAPTRKRRGRAAGSRGRRRGPRFVIHEHSATRLHWDLRLEHDGALASWALPKGLPDAPGDNRFAAHTEDHPLEYLEFHGEIPAGQYGAGTMTIWDSGTYETIKWEPRKIEVALHGGRVDARYALFPIKGGGDPKDWMIHRMDPPEDPGREPMPQRIVPMLARSGELPREEDRWAFEVKWDGVRTIAYSQPGELRFESRNLNDVTDRYPELARLGRALGSSSAVLDGEIVALDERGRPSFEALQQRMGLTSRAQAKRRVQSHPVTYIVFDLLWLDGHSLMDLPYIERRARLQALRLSGEHWRTPEHVIGHGEELLRASAEQGLEGIVAKRVDCPYQPGVRSTAWVKVKTVQRQELVVGGFTRGKGRRSEGIGALLVGVHDRDGALRYAGRVGSGFSERELERLERLLTPLLRSSSPFGAGPSPPRGSRFTEPRLVAEIEFSEWTAQGILRQPRYKGLREDKSPEEVVREATPEAEADSDPLVIRERGSRSAQTTVEGRELTLSNLDKVLYPGSGFAKRQLIDYYAGIARVMLPHLDGRALTVTRWPDGVEGKSFFQKDAPGHRPDWVPTVRMAGERKAIDYVLAEDRATLVWLANLAAIELHTPLARAQEPGRPTMLVFDLDPGPPADVIQCCEIALALEGMFSNLGLSSFVKTSGSKGLQVYLPLNTDGVTFEQTKPFARAVAELLEQAEPELVVSRMTKARRTGKVLIDWSQNDPHKTTVCAYSLRAAPAPTASTPLEWDEVRSALRAREPAELAFDAQAVLARVAERGDIFAPVLSLAQELPSL
jgi:bifunctional non-homologous end joining protein LigD